jgi:hypothetical protein
VIHELVIHRLILGIILKELNVKEILCKCVVPFEVISFASFHVNRLEVEIGT